MKKILITGANSYIGINVKKWLLKENSEREEYIIDTLDVRDAKWINADFSEYDVVFHVAGIAHQKETRKNAHLYYEINEELAVSVARKAKDEKVKHFIILSSMSVYGMETGVINKNTIPHPNTHYGISKYNADKKIQQLADLDYVVSILRPPMVYGKDCKGNYQLLRKFALHFPVFPKMENQRSMIYIENLAEFVRKVIDEKTGGLFFPQDAEYVCTWKMVEQIALNCHKHVIGINLFNPIIRWGIDNNILILKKIFGNLTYEKCDNESVDSFEKIMKKIEG